MRSKLKDESGASDVLSILIMISIVLILAFLFRENISALVKHIFSFIFDMSSSYLNGHKHFS